MWDIFCHCLCSNFVVNINKTHWPIRHNMVGPDCTWKYIYKKSECIYPNWKVYFSKEKVFLPIANVHNYCGRLPQDHSRSRQVRVQLLVVWYKKPWQKLKMQLIFIFVTCFSCKTHLLLCLQCLWGPDKTFLHQGVLGPTHGWTLRGSCSFVLVGRNTPGGAFLWQDSWKIFFSKVGGVPSWIKGLERGFEDDEDDNICGLWQRVQTKFDQLQILPWHKVHLYLYLYLYL